MSDSTASTWPNPQLATPGAMPNGTSMGAVELLVHDLDKLTDFYHRLVGLDVISAEGDTVILGRGNAPIIILTQRKELPLRSPRTPGLYHSAIVFSSGEDLARTFLRLRRAVPHLYVGASDHLVSEAFYFDDPEGNGLELYIDRPADEWHKHPNGDVVMTVDPLDIPAFIRRHVPEAANTSLSEIDTEVSNAQPNIIGHIHLQVGNVPRAKEFYSGVLGFDVTTDFGSAATFLSAGGYHHHIGLNSWHIVNDSPRASTLGLGTADIQLPTRADVQELSDRLRHHEVGYEDNGRSVEVKDPWGTLLRFHPANA